MSKKRNKENKKIKKREKKRKKRNMISNQQHAPHKHNIIEEGGYEVCSRCGLCFGKVVSASNTSFKTDARGNTEVREFSHHIRYPRSTNLIVHRHIGGSKKWHRLKNVSMYFNSQDQNLHKYLRLIKDICNALALPRHIRLNALYRYQKGRAQIELKNRVYFSAYCILCASRHFKFPLRYEHLVKEFYLRGHRINEALLMRAYRRYSKDLDGELCVTHRTYLSTHLSTLYASTGDLKGPMLSRFNYLDPLAFLAEIRGILSEVLEKLEPTSICLTGDPAITSATLIYFANKILQCRHDILPLNRSYVLNPALLSRLLNIPATSIHSAYNQRFKPFLVMNLKEEGLNTVIMRKEGGVA